MPRLPRIHIEEGLYFITTRRDHGDVLFKDDADYEQYLALLRKYKEQYRFKLFSYVLMAKFVHLLLEMGPNNTISEVMHAINSTYTRYYNSRYQRHGHLFQGRFKAAVVEKEKFLTILSRFIHLVPRMAHIAHRPEDYKWSSFASYADIGATGDAKEVLKRFSDNAFEGVRLYREFMNSASEEELESLRKKIQKASVLGSAEFTEEMKTRLKVKIEKDKQEEKALEKAGKIFAAHKAFIIIGSVVLMLLGVFTVYSYNMNKRAVAKVQGLVQERETKLKKDLEEKYRDDMVSYYHAVVKRIEREKKLDGADSNQN